MLTNEALQSALPLTSIFDDRKLIVMPIDGTPLAALVGATRSDSHFMAQSTPGEYYPDVVNIEYIANAKDKTLGYSPHDMVMDEIVETCVKAVQGHMLFARTVVAPAVAELVEKTAGSLKEITPSSLLGMNVVTWAAPQPMENSTLEQLVRRFQDTPFDVPRMALKMPTITVKEIVDLMGTGTASLDSAIADWVAAKGESFFLTLWENVFQLKQNEGTQTPRDFRGWIEDKEDGIHNALAIFLLARRLFEQGPLEGTEMPLPAFEALIVEYRNQAAARLGRAFDELDLVRKTKTLVRSISGTTTVVNELVYRDWIEAGGDNDVLFGNMLVQPSLSTVEQINEAAEALRAKWNGHAALTATVESVRNFNRTKEILSRHFNDQMRQITEGEEATVANRETVIKLFGEELDKVRQDEMGDLWSLCLRLVCRSRFFRTDAERILAGIERVKKENPNIDVREAAAVSMIEYIGHWVASQFKVQAL